MQLGSMMRTAGFAALTALGAETIVSCGETSGVVFRFYERNPTIDLNNIQAINREEISSVSCEAHKASQLQLALSTSHPADMPPMTRLFVNFQGRATVVMHDGACNPSENIGTFTRSASIENSSNDARVTGVYINLTDSLPSGMTYCIGVTTSPLCNGLSGFSTVTVSLP